MNDLLKQQMNMIDTVTKVMDETPEETESRRKDNDDRRNYSHRSDRQKAHASYELKESDFF